MSGNVMVSEVEVTRPSQETSSASPGLPGLPLLGFRNYWYPLIQSRRVNKHPVPIRILGEDLVLFRSEGKVGALVDRCPHRGTRLSLGRVIFPGTLSCDYHGWTYNRQGECLAALVEGPDSKVPGKVRVRAYSVEERFGVVWVFMGEGELPPLDEDLPPDALQPDFSTLQMFEEWKCDWRNVAENIVDSSHPYTVHRNSLLFRFQKIPGGAGGFTAEVLPDGKGIHTKAVDLIRQADYPGLGKFPQDFRWRRLPRKGAGSGLEMRMPGYVVVRRKDPYFGVSLIDWQWLYAIEENRCRIFFFTTKHANTRFERLMLRGLWWYHRPFRKQFVHQDRRLLEPVNYRDPERLSAGDAGVVAFRAFSARAARRSSGSTGANGGAG